MPMAIRKLGRRKYRIDLYDAHGKRIRPIINLPRYEVEIIHNELLRKKYFEKWGVDDIKNMTVDKFFDSFLSMKRRSVGPVTYRQYNPRVEFWKKVHTRKSSQFIPLSKEEIERELGKLDLLPQTINHYILILKQIYKYAQEEDLIRKNPAKSIKKSHERGKKPPRFLTQEEVKRILECSTDFYKGLFNVLLYTGMRRDEARFLEWNDIDFQKGIIKIRNKDEFSVKTKKGRNIPMHPIVKEILIKGRQDSGYVFVTSERTQYTVSTWLKYLNKLTKKLGIKNASLHTFRHTFASWLAKEGVEMRTIAELLGHSDIKTTMIYSHLAPEHVKKAVERLPNI